MGFDKNYPNRKDRRKKYYDSRAAAGTCRSHGSCTWCLGNRLHKHKKKQNVLTEEDIKWLKKI